MSTTSTTTAFQETYRGYSIVITRTERTDSVLMPVEYMVFIGGDLVFDELDMLLYAQAKARQAVDASIKAVKGN